MFLLTRFFSSINFLTPIKAAPVEKPQNNASNVNSSSQPCFDDSLEILYILSTTFKLRVEGINPGPMPSITLFSFGNTPII